MNKQLTTFFLLSVLVLGLINTPSTLSKLSDNTQSFQFGNHVFAQTEEETEDNEDSDIEVEAEVEVEIESEEAESEETEEAEEAEEKKEIEIEVEIENGQAEITIKIDNEEEEYTLDTDVEAEIIASISEKTGLTETEIKEIWKLEIETEDETEDEEEKAKKRAEKETERETRLEEKRKEREARQTEVAAEVELRLAERAAEREDKALQRAEDLIQKLEEKIANLEQRLQSLLQKLETGEYYGPVPQESAVTKSYNLFFEGSAQTIDGEQTEVEMSGEIFLETLVQGNRLTKFKITGGDLIIGEQFYDLAFGKARATSAGAGGDNDSLLLISQVTDAEGNLMTLKILLDATTQIEAIGSEPVEVEIMMPQSKIAGQWMLSGSGQLTLTEG